MVILSLNFQLQRIFITTIFIIKDDFSGNGIAFIFLYKEEGRGCMIHVQYMKPFYTKTHGNMLRLVFAYQYFSIIKDGELYHFVPTEGKEMVVNLNTLQIENLSEIFVFQKGNRYIRLPLYQLLLISNVHEHLKLILENTKVDSITSQFPIVEKSDVKQLLKELEIQNINRLVDEALKNRDETLFYKLIEQKNKLLN